jgi:hypothetical protein
MADRSSRSRRRRPTGAAPEDERTALNVDHAGREPGLADPGAGAEIEIIDQAVDLLLFQEEAMSGLRKLEGRGHEIANLFDPHLEL